MTKRTKLAATLMAGGAALSACERIVDVEVPTAPPRLVVEGRLVADRAPDDQALARWGQDGVCDRVLGGDSQDGPPTIRPGQLHGAAQQRRRRLGLMGGKLPH